MSTLQRRLMLLVALVLVVQAGANVASYFLELREGGRFGGDFMSFWSAARHAWAGERGAIYDPERWRAVLAKGGRPSLTWFVYPPYALIFLWPLGALSYGAAVAVWSLAPLAPLGGLGWRLARRSGLGDDGRPAQAFAVTAAITLPWLLASVFTGQTGLIVAALFLGIAWAWPSRPILLGICVGLLAIKPQLGLLLPFALVAAGQWRAIAAAIVTIAVTSLAATVWLGPQAWADWLALTKLFGQTVGAGYSGFRQLTLSPYVALVAVGAPKLLAGAMQAGASLAVTWVIVRVFPRSDADDGRLDLRLGLLATGALLATPYALTYDMPLLALALIPLMARAWRSGWDGLELLGLAGLVLAPFATPTLVKLHIPAASAALALTLAALALRYAREGPAAATGGRSMSESRQPKPAKRTTLAA